MVAATGEKPGGRSEVLLIGKDPDHPNGTHMYMLTCEKLAMCLKQTAVVSNGWPADEKILEGVKTIVIYTDPTAERILDGPGAEKFEAMMKDARSRCARDSERRRFRLAAEARMTKGLLVSPNEVVL